MGRAGEGRCDSACSLELTAVSREVEGDESTVQDFVERLQRDNRPTPHYLFDWGIPKLCPELLAGFVMPRYFSQDFLQRTPAKVHSGW
jgi:hypothetical protein